MKLPFMWGQEVWAYIADEPRLSGCIVEWIDTAIELRRYEFDLNLLSQRSYE